MKKAQVLSQSADRHPTQLRHLIEGQLGSAVQLDRSCILFRTFRACPAPDVVVDAQFAAQCFTPDGNVRIMGSHEIGKCRAVHAEFPRHLRDVQVDVFHHVARCHGFLVFGMCRSRLTSCRLDASVLLHAVATQHQLAPVPPQVSTQRRSRDATLPRNVLQRALGGGIEGDGLGVFLVEGQFRQRSNSSSYRRK